MPEHPAIRGLVRKFLIAIIVLLFLVVLAINVFYQLDYGALSGVGYKLYIIESINAILLIMGGYAVYRLITYLVLRSFGSRIDSGGAYAVTLAIQVVFYVLIIALVLTSFGVSLSTALAGGAVGGIVLGLAVQTVATNLLSGIFVSSSRVLKPGDMITINTGMWGQINPMVWGEVTCSIAKIGMLWTTVVNRYGNTMLIPNSALFSTIIFTKLRDDDGTIYVQNVTVNADVPLKELLKKAAKELESEFSKRKMQAPEVHVFSKNGSTTTISAVIKLSSLSELNELIDSVNYSFDNAYWDVKSKRK